MDKVARDLGALDSKVRIEFKRLPLFKDCEAAKWPVLYLAKCRAAATQIADFSDPKKDADLKDDKKECLIELVDVLDESEASETLLNE